MALVGFFWSSIFFNDNRKTLQVYVIGSSSKLGQWKIQDGLKLSYAGDSFWHAECILQKAEFPLKYPFRIIIFTC